MIADRNLTDRNLTDFDEIRRNLNDFDGVGCESKKKVVSRISLLCAHANKCLVCEIAE